MKCEYPADEAGEVIPRVLPEAQLRDFQGVMGHYHIQANKTDPGPAFDWKRVVGGAKEIIANSGG
jgi:N-acetylmuramoyl-L-alanine amidase